MRSIGILTYHRSANYGAVLQAYSLSKKLMEDFPDCRVEIIDYISEKTYRLYHRSAANYLRIICSSHTFKEAKPYVRLLLIFLRSKAAGKNPNELNLFFENEIGVLPLSSEFIVTDDNALLFSKINGKYDVLVVGSDAVWNWQIRKFPTPYFLKGIDLSKKMSYAASSYGQDFADLTDDQRDYIAAALNDFSYIGVRDETTMERVSELVDTDICVRHNCDPTVFLDVDKIPADLGKLRKRLEHEGIDFSKPVFGIMGEEWLAKLAREILGNDAQLVSLYLRNSVSNLFLDRLPPLEWARVFALFDVTFTHYFHGNLLSLRNGTPTICIENRTPYNAKYNSKIRDLMERIGRTEFCHYRDAADPEAIRQQVEAFIENKEQARDRIFTELKKEESSYISFRDALTELLQ